MKKDIVHIVSHTHWDREWYINSKFVNEWLPAFFDNLFAMLEREPEYKFVLDGQMSMVDDCCAELDKGGQSTVLFLSRIRKYASQGRLVLGPYYLQPDWQLISGEAIIRNMEFGISEATGLGGCSSTGWLLDNFGQIAQAPQIHKLFGMKGIVVWRGVEMPPDNVNSEFEWASPDGTVMTTAYLLSSYRNAMRLADYPLIFHGRIKNEVNKIREFSKTGNILLMNGYDQEIQPDNILPYLREQEKQESDFSVRQSTPDAFMDTLLSSPAELQRLNGALYSGRYISVFPGVLSTRIYLKQANQACQCKLERYVEPLAVMSYLLGYDYPTELLRFVWKKLLKTHPHDSICGVGVDDVHSDMEQAFCDVTQQSDQLLNEAAARICGAADTSAIENAAALFTIINPLLHRKKALIEIPCHEPCQAKTSDGTVLPCQQTPNGLLVEMDLPSLSCSSIGLYPFPCPLPPLPKEPVQVENSYLVVDFCSDGTLNVLDKRSNKQYTKLGYFEDSADSGDEYNYSFLTDDLPLTTLGQESELTVIEQGALRTVVRISRIWQLPVSLVGAERCRSKCTIALPITTDVTIEHDSDVIQFSTQLRNRCRDHRLRVVFPTQLATATSYAHTQFDITPHPIVPPDFDNSAIPDHVSRIVIGARESMPITQFPQCDFAAVSDGSVGVAVFNRGLPEYEVLPNDTAIAITLFRSVGWLARTDLNTRIGDAGPEIFVPEAQCLRDMTFQYAFHPFVGNVRSSSLLCTSEDWIAPPLVCSNTRHRGIAPTLSFASLSPCAGTAATACKLSPYSDRLLFRLHNASEQTTHQTLSVAQEVLDAHCTDLLGHSIGTLSPERFLHVDMAPGQIYTLEIGIKRMVISSAPANITVFNPTANPQSFEAFALPPVVCERDVKLEQVRAKLALERYRSATIAFEQYGDFFNSSDADSNQQLEAATAHALMHSCHRTMLEAKLSLLFTKAKLAETQFGTASAAASANRKGLEGTLRETAYQLNLARINKRVSEYLQDYYRAIEG